MVSRSWKENMRGEWEMAFQRKQQQRILLDELKLCSSTKNLRKGKEIHAEAMKTGNDSCIYVANALVNMYAKCGSMAKARQMFDEIKHPDVVSWSTLMFGYADNGEGFTALELFAMMRSQGCLPNHITFVAALKACTNIALGNGNVKAQCLERGKEIHSWIGSHHMNKYVQNTLINMYAKCGSMTDARAVFDSMKNKDVVSWTAIILGFAENGEGATALDLFETMKFQGCVPDNLVFVAALKACTFLAEEKNGSGKQKCLEWGKQIHSDIGCLSRDAYIQNTLIFMYANCGSMADAHQVFDSMRHPDLVSWNALIMGYAENGEGDLALDLFARMKSRGCAPDCITFVAALKACEVLGALESGRKIHAEIDNGAQRDAILVNCLVDFYAKCGSMVEAQDVFDLYPGTRSLTTWTSLLAGYSLLGDGKAVFELFERMQDAGVKPDGVTFVCILSCCSHAGLVEKAKEVFEIMSTKYGIAPTLEHYNCMVDILSRSNKLENAMALLEGMPFKANAVTWMSILGACCKWKNVETGRLAFKSLVDLGDANSAAYVLMAQIFKSRGMFKEQKMMKVAMRKQFEVWKEARQACWTNDDGKVHKFVVADR